MQQLQPLVANSKLDRPLDSHPPLSRELMLTRLETDDWGNMYEDTKKSTKIRTIGKSSISKNTNLLNKTMSFTTRTPMRQLTDMKKKWLNMIILKKERRPSRVKMNIRTNDGQVSLPWKTSLYLSKFTSPRHD
jgi:hypothetical protein